MADSPIYKALEKDTSTNTVTEPVISDELPLNVVGSDPPTQADIGKFFAKTAGGRVEAHYKDDTGVVTQITADGAVNGGSSLGRNAFPNWSLVYQGKAYSASNNERQVADLAWSPTLLKFMLAGNYNVSFSSGDGFTWTSVSRPSDAEFQGVIWAAAPLNVFIAFAYYDGNTLYEDIAVSSDGLTWASLYITHDAQWSCAAFAPAPFNGGLGRVVVLASSNGAITAMTSDDSITWNSQGNVGGGFRDVLFSVELGLFVTVGDVILRSPTGLAGSWSSAAYAPSSYFKSVAWSPTLGILVAVTDIDSDRIISSTDANNWTVATPPEVGDWSTVIWADPVFLVMGSNNNTILVSDDGLTWGIRTAPALLGLTTASYAPELGFVLAASQGFVSFGYRVTKHLISMQIERPIHVEAGIKLRQERIDEFALTSTSPGAQEVIYVFKTSGVGVSIGLVFEVIASRLLERAHFVMSAMAVTDVTGSILVQDITYLNGPFRDVPDWDVDVLDYGDGQIAIKVFAGALPSGIVAWRITGTVTEHYVADGPDLV